MKVARVAAEAGISGLSFLRGIPGTVGGALRMNGGAYGGETKDVLIEATGVSTQRSEVVLHQRANGLYLSPHRGSRRRDLHRCAVSGAAGGSGDHSGRNERDHRGALLDPAREYAHRRFDVQEIRRGAKPGNWWTRRDAEGSGLGTPRCPRCIATSSSTMAPQRPQISRILGEAVRRRVRDVSGIELAWEIKRVGRALP